MGRAGRGRVQVVEDEVPSRDRVDRVGGNARKTELVRHLAPIGVEVHTGERPRAERQRSRLRLGEVEASPIAREHPEVREQMMTQIHGLGAL